MIWTWHTHTTRACVTMASPLGVAGAPVQVRNHGTARVHTQSAAFLQSELPVAGFALTRAASIDQAVEIVSQTPCAVAHGIIEVWPWNRPRGSVS